MARGITVAISILLAAFLIFEMSSSNVSAKNSEDIGDVLKNQEVILEKIGAIEKKLEEMDGKINVIKIWVKP